MPILIIHGEERLECPCCKGRGYLIVWDHNIWDGKAVEIGCTHCMGDGTIPVDRPAGSPKHE